MIDWSVLIDDDYFSDLDGEIGFPADIQIWHFGRERYKGDKKGKLPQVCDDLRITVRKSIGRPKKSIEGVRKCGQITPYIIGAHIRPVPNQLAVPSDPRFFASHFFLSKQISVPELQLLHNLIFPFKGNWKKQKQKQKKIILNLNNLF